MPKWRQFDSIPLYIGPAYIDRSIVFARWRQCAPHVTRASLGSPESKTQTAYRSIQPFWATVCKTVHPMLSDRCMSVCPVCLSCPVCNVGVLPSNGWMDQDETWYGRRHRPWPHCVRWGPRSHSPKGRAQPPIFDPCLF